MPSSRSRLSAIHSGCGFAPPASPVRAPAATTGTPSSDATARTRAAPAASDGRTAAAGRARSATELSPAYPSSSAPATTASLPAASASLRARAPGAIAAQSRLRAVVQPRATGPGFRPYAWAQTAAQVAARHGLSPAHVLRFDANLPALPAPLPVAAGRALAERGEYPEGRYAELRADAASYAGCAPAEVVVDAGADGLLYLVARAFLGPGRRAVVPGPTYPVYAIASRGEGAAVDEQPAADLDGLRSARRARPVALQPGQSGRAARPAGRDRRARGRSPGHARLRRRGVLRVLRRDGRSTGARTRQPRRRPHALEGVRARGPPRRVRGGIRGGRTRADGAPSPAPGRGRPRPARLGGVARSSRRPCGV